MASAHWTAEAGTLVLQVTLSPAGPTDDPADNSLLVTIRVAEAKAAAGKEPASGIGPWGVGGGLVIITIIGAFLVAYIWRNSRTEGLENPEFQAGEAVTQVPAPYGIVLPPGTAFFGSDQVNGEPSPPLADSESEVEWSAGEEEL